MKQNVYFIQLLMFQKESFEGRTLPVSVSTDARARLWERRAGAGGRRGGVPGGILLLLFGLLFDSSESRARDKEEDLLSESRLELLLRGNDRFKDSLLASFPALFCRLCLFNDSRLESLAVPRDSEVFVPVLLSRLESLGGLVVNDLSDDFSDSRLSFLLPLPGGFGAVGFVHEPGNGIRLGRLRGEGLTSAAW